MKSERLKKLESELKDLEQWMKLGLVPKKEIKRHSEEIDTLKGKIKEEKDRLQFIKESGEGEEYTAPRRAPAKSAYPQEMPSMSDIDLGEETSEASIEETEAMDYETTEETSTETVEEGGEEEEEAFEEEEDPFSDRNRWRRGGILDPDANEW